MSDSKDKAALQVAEYRRRSGLRRANSKLKSSGGATSSRGITVTNGIVIVQAPQKDTSTKTVAQAGGPSKVFGKSTIFIPEFRISPLRK